MQTTNQQFDARSRWKENKEMFWGRRFERKNMTMTQKLNEPELRQLPNKEKSGIILDEKSQRCFHWGCVAIGWDGLRSNGFDSFN